MPFLPKPGQPGAHLPPAWLPPAWLPPAWQTVRVRLTAVYGALFLFGGAALLVMTNLMVRRTAGDAIYSAPPGAALPSAGGRPVRTDQLPVSAHQLQAELARLHAHDLDQFLIQSAVALAVAAVVCVLLGYVMARRALRPVRVITAKARGITAHNLHERVGVTGPADELKELGDTFDALLSRLDRAFQAQRQFIANASHELRAPLTRQRTITEVALADPGASAQALRAAHERVLAAELQQQRLIDALLDLARGQAGWPEPRPADLAAITAHVVDSRRDEARQHGIGVTSSLGPAVTDGDPRLVERLVTNLVDNAIQHNTAGGRVEIGTSTAGGRARLDVSNTGPCLPADAIERIFQPFRRISTDRVHRGNHLGLGLSIVRAIADSHQATIAACPRPAGGLHIQVSFTAAEDPQRPSRSSVNLMTGPGG